MKEDVRIRRELALRVSVLAGDEAAWRTWYDEAYEPLRTFVFWKNGRQLDGVDEIVQETWLIAVRRIRDFEPQKGAFSDWIRGIAANVIRNRNRIVPFSTANYESIAKHNESKIGHEQQNTDRSTKIAEVLVALPEQYAAVLKAKYLEKRSVNEIAEAWNQTTKAIESLLTRARSAFRNQFGDE